MKKDLEDFREWLMEERVLSPKSSKDVVSRFRRVAGLVRILSKDDAVSTIRKLEKSESFLAISTLVRPQLRRSVRLYFEFKGLKK